MGSILLLFKTKCILLRETLINLGRKFSLWPKAQLLVLGHGSDVDKFRTGSRGFRVFLAPQQHVEIKIQNNSFDGSRTVRRVKITRRGSGR